MEAQDKDLDFVSVSKIDLMTDARKLRLQKEEDKWNRFKSQEEMFREKLRKAGKSEHYIFLNEGKASAYADDIGRDLTLEILGPIITELVESPHARAQRIWYEKNLAQINGNHARRLKRATRR